MKNLLISICGDRSLHKLWMQGRQPADFDLFVVYYGDVEDRYKNDGLFYDTAKGTKFVILDQIAQRHFKTIREYDAVFVPDDDILIDTDGINHFFEIFHKYELQIAQPAVMGWMSVPVVSPSFGTVLRYVNWVEIMTPCFSRDAFGRCQLTFAENKSNWGIEFLWFEELGRPEDKIAIIDDAVAIHSRPCFYGDTYQLNRGSFDTSIKELYELLDRHGLTEERKVFGSVPLDMSEWHDRPSEYKFFPNSTILNKKLWEIHSSRMMI